MTKNTLADENDKLLKARFAEQLQKQLKTAPEIVQAAAEVIRENNLESFKDFLHRNLIPVPDEHAAAFRDFIITQRIDLKDLEPAARARLRQTTLETNSDDLKDATSDYLCGKSGGIDLRCRHCEWFVKAPNDGDGDNHDKTCVALGTKGTDEACPGFVWDLDRVTKSA
jgi:hypothetical protein